jgi:hypothetical protein
VTAAPTANPKFKRTRIVLEDGDLVRPLLALGVSADGGLILDLSSSAPVTRYRYGVVDVPAGQGSFQAAIRKDQASWSDSVPPKLHYHRSGLISLSATRKLERQAIQATPIGKVGPGHKHCFSFIARHPFAWKKVTPRKSDLRFATSQAPTTVTVAGFIGHLCVCGVRPSAFRRVLNASQYTPVRVVPACPGRRLVDTTPLAGAWSLGWKSCGSVPAPRKIALTWGDYQPRE